MSTLQIITLCIAVLGAVTGTISFSLQMWQQLKYRPRLIAELIGVYELPSEDQMPPIVIVIEYRNPSKDKVTVLRTPDIIVKDHLGNILGKFNLDPWRWDEPVQVALDPQEIRALSYSGRELSTAMTSGLPADVLSTDANCVFEIVGESTAGRFTARAKGMRRLDKKTVEWLKIAGGIESKQAKASEQGVPTEPDKPRR